MKKGLHLLATCGVVDGLLTRFRYHFWPKEKSEESELNKQTYNTVNLLLTDVGNCTAYRTIDGVVPAAVDCDDHELRVQLSSVERQGVTKALLYGCFACNSGGPLTPARGFGKLAILASGQGYCMRLQSRGAKDID